MVFVLGGSLTILGGHESLLCFFISSYSDSCVCFMWRLLRWGQAASAGGRALKAALPIPPATPTRGEPHPFSTPANLMWCAQNTCNCSRHKSMSCIVLFECAISLLLCCLMLASQEGNHGYKLCFLSSWIVMITIWFHFLLCIQCSLSHRCPYIHSSDLLFSAAPYSKHKAVDALRAQCRLRRLSGKPGLGLHTVYQHPPTSPFTDLQVNPSSPPIHASSFPELGVWLHGNLCFGAHHVLLALVGQWGFPFLVKAKCTILYALYFCCSLVSMLIIWAGVNIHF